MRKIFWILAGITLATQLSAQTNLAPVRLAIVPETTEVRAAADVLTAEFSKNDQVQLLERAEIERVYREQGLSAGNKDYLKLGQILGADGLLLLDNIKEGTNQFMNLRLIAVKPGVVLTAEKFSWPVKEVTEWSSALSKHLEVYFPKLAVLKKDALPLTIVNLRSSVASESSVETERQLKLLAIQRLSREPQLFVLERQKLQLLGDEKNLNTDESAFWSGSYLLDGVVDQNGYSHDTITINAQLTPPQGGTPMTFAVSGSRTNLTEVINQLAAKVAAALKVKLIVKEWSAAAEAQQFFEEANWALRWGVFKEAQAAADSAWALGKQDLACALVRVKAYLMEVEASSITYQYPESTLSPGYNADGKPIGQAPSDAEVQAEIKRLKARYPLMSAYHVSEVNRAKSINCAVADRLPAPENIDCALHALELYLEFSRRSPEGEAKILTRGKGWHDWHNSDWYQLGLDNLVAASKVLQGFYFMPPKQKDDGEKLAALRERTRAVAGLLFESPSVHDSYYVGGRAASHDELERTIGRNSSIFAVLINWAAFWQEKPDNTVALYRKLMESPAFCYLHGALWSRDLLQPRLVAWNPDDRSRLPRLWEDFCNELNGSTNLLWRLEAHALALTTSTDSVKTGTAFTNFFEEIFTNSAALVANPVEVLYSWDGEALLTAANRNSLYSEDKDRLSRTYFTVFRPRLEQINREYWTKTIPAAQVADAFDKQKEYLRQSPPFNFMEFTTVFREKAYNQKQAEEILPLIIAYKSNLLAQSEQAAKAQQFKLKNDAHSVEFFLQREVEQILHPAPLTPLPQPAATAAPRSPSPAARPVLPAVAAEPDPATNVITVEKFLEIPLARLGDEITGATICAHHWQENKLVLDLNCSATIYSFDNKGHWQSTRNTTRPAIAILDPATEKWDVIGCPEPDIVSLNNFYHRTTLWRGVVFTSEGGRIQKYDPAKKSWQTLEIPGAGNCELFTVNDHLYAATLNLIVEITDGGTGSHILASNRRQPPVSALDSENLGTPALFAGPGHSLRAAVGNKIAEWNGSDWRTVCPAPKAPLPPVITDEGILFLADGWNSSAGVWRLNTGSDTVEFCLGQEQQTGFVTPQPGAEKKPKPIWNLPAKFSLSRLPTAGRGTDVFLMTDHARIQDIVDEQHHEVTAKKILPQDGYHAELFCFVSNLPAPLKVLLKFADHEGAAPPVTGQKSTGGFTPPGTPVGWMGFIGGQLILGRELPDHFGGSDSSYFPKAGIWVVPQSKVDSELIRLNNRQQKSLAKAEMEKSHELKSLLEKFDSNHDGVIDGEEREAALADEKFVAGELDKIDANHNGWLEAAELAYFDANKNQTLEPAEQTGIEATEHLLAVQLVRKFDLDGDGFLDRREFNTLTQTSLEPLARSMLGNPFPDNNHDGKMDVDEVQSVCEQQTLRGLRSRRMPGTPGFNPIPPRGNPALDVRQIFKNDVEIFWQISGGTPARPPNGAGA